MKKGKKIIVTISKDGPTTIGADCLATDSWADFMHFLDAARGNKETGADRTVNRELRAALLCLFAHLEGTIGQVLRERAHGIEGADIARTLCDQSRVITAAAKKRTSVHDLNFRLGKYLRDIVVHPGIEKTFGGETVDETAVFENLTIQSVTELGHRIDAWLDCICPVFEVGRFTDTKSMVDQFAEASEDTHETCER